MPTSQPQNHPFNPSSFSVTIDQPDDRENQPCKASNNLMNKNYALFPFLLMLLAPFAAPQNPAAASILKPPKGSQVALVVFEDLECPDCRRAAPLVVDAGKTYKIPVVRYDFPLPMHPWSFDAAVFARYFANQNPDLGVDFREYIFQNQPEINKANLRTYVERFATEHKVDLPFAVDPQGKLAAAVTADKDLGTRVGIEHTPTIYVVSNKNPSRPFVEVVDRSQLFQLIDTMKRN